MHENERFLIWSWYISRELYDILHPEAQLSDGQYYMLWDALHDYKSASYNARHGNDIDEHYTIEHDTVQPTDLMISELDAYINRYIEAWLNDEIYSEKRNIPKSIDQLQKTLRHTFGLAQDYSSKGIIIDIETESEEGGIFACLVFLCLCECLRIDLILPGGGHVYRVRVCLLPRFFVQFTLLASSEIFYDIEEVLGYGNDASPHLFVDDSGVIWNKVEKYLPMAGLPRAIADHLFRDGKLSNTPMQMLATELCTNEDNVKKSLENFRRSLRQRFNLPSTVTLFDIVDGVIYPDPSVFRHGNQTKRYTLPLKDLNHESIPE